MADFFLSFHGGSSGLTNIVAYNDTVLATDGPVAFDELRGFTGFEGGLLVVNASGDTGSVIGFQTGSCSEPWVNPSVFCSANLVHPFDIVQGFSGNVFVSNQSSKKGSGGNNITYYSPNGSYLGTISYAFQQVRGLTYDGTYLYAADTKADAVQRFTGAGAQPTAITGGIKKPDHLWYDGLQYLYIGCEDDGIYVYDTKSPPSGNLPKFLDASKAKPAFASIAGFAFTSSHVYVANRTGNAIQRYEADFSANPPVVQNPQGGAVLFGTTDNPEFIYPAYYYVPPK